MIDEPNIIIKGAREHNLNQSIFPCQETNS